MVLKAIVAASENNVIGVGQAIPWHLPKDFKYFKTITTGHPIIMGKNTWLTFPKPLPNRLNIVISNTLSATEVPEGVLVFPHFEDAILFLEDNSFEMAFLIGGGILYNAYLNLVDEVYFTRVHTHIDNGTAFFPTLLDDEWILIASEMQQKDEKHLHDYTFELWRRK